MDLVSALSGYSSFVTLPTHDVYALNSNTDDFEAIIFVNNNAHVTNAWTFELKYL